MGVATKILVLFLTTILLILPIHVRAQAPDTLWTRTYGYDNINDEAWQLKATSDGGFIIVGFSQTDDNIFLIKTDENGDSLWTSLLGFTSDDVGRSVEPLDDGGYIITGYAGGYIVLMKTDSLGNHLWHHYLESGWGRAVRVTSDRGFIVAGYTPGVASSEDIFIARTDSFGDTIWSRTYGDSALQVPWDVRETIDGGFIIIGWREPFGETSDIYILRLDANGDSLWSRTYGGLYNDEVRSVVVKDNGEFMIAGKFYNSGTGMDVAVINLDANGDTIWTRSFPEDGTQIVNSIAATSDGNYVLTGMRRESSNLYAAFIMKIDPNGDSLWYRHISDPAQNLYLRSIVQTSDGGYVAAGYHQVPNQANDVFLIKLAADITRIEDEIAILPDQITLYQNYPNPFNANTAISFTLSEPQDIVLSIYDLLGRKISVLFEGYFDAGIHNITFDAGDLTSGIYFYNLKAGDISETKPMILLK